MFISQRGRRTWWKQRLEWEVHLCLLKPFNARVIFSFLHLLPITKNPNDTYKKEPVYPLNCHKKTFENPMNFHKKNPSTPNESSHEKTLYTQQIFHRKYLCIPSDLHRKNPISPIHFSTIYKQMIIIWNCNSMISLHCIDTQLFFDRYQIYPIGFAVYTFRQTLMMLLTIMEGSRPSFLVIGHQRAHALQWPHSCCHRNYPIVLSITPPRFFYGPIPYMTMRETTKMSALPN